MRRGFLLPHHSPQDMPVIKIEKKAIYTSVRGIEDVVVVGTDMYAPSDKWLKRTITKIGPKFLYTLTSLSEAGEELMTWDGSSVVDLQNRVQEHLALSNRPTFSRHQIESFFAHDRNVTLRQLQAIKDEEIEAGNLKRKDRELYSSWGSINPLNFQMGTVAIFKRCAYPDPRLYPYHAASPKSSSEYFGNSEWLIRVSDHWGEFGTYWWFLDEQLGKHVYARGLWTGYPIAGCVRWKDIRNRGYDDDNVTDRIYSIFEQARESKQAVWRRFNAWDSQDVLDLWRAESGKSKG